MTKTIKDATNKDEITRIKVTFIPRPDFFLHDGHLKTLGDRISPHFTHLLAVSLVIESLSYIVVPLDYGDC